MPNLKSVRSGVITLNGALAAVLCTVLAATLLTPTATAQIIGDVSEDMLNAASSNPLLMLRQRLTQASLTSAGIPLEGVVDEDEYLVGPGDSFNLSINGQDGVGASMAVGADGRIALPDAGLIKIGGLTLREARYAIIDSLKPFYNNSDIEASLVQSRQFYVHVTGAVPLPGRYMALPVARVSNAVEFAFADTTSAPVANADFQPSLRNIEIRRTDGSVVEVDLVRYLTTGDRSANPYLRDGDVIFVPAHNPEYSGISVGGHVPHPGMYEFKEGDELLHILQVAGGFSTRDGAESVHISRIGADGMETFRFSAEEMLNDGASFSLRARDVISVAERAEEQGLVRVDGRVNFPGTYPIIDGQTSLQELLQASGGFKDDALIRGVYLERRSLPDPARFASPNRFEDQTLAVEQMLKADTTAILQRLRLTDLDFLSRAYFTQELRLQNRVSMDIEEVLEGFSDPVLLRSGDRLFIPTDLNTIYVFGQVNQPGYIPVMPGESVEYYLAKAGGRSQGARQVLIINPSSGAYSENLGQTMLSGDIIFVDRLEDLADTADMARLLIEADRISSDARIRMMQTILQSVGTLASVVALVISIRRN